MKESEIERERERVTSERLTSWIHGLFMNPGEWICARERERARESERERKRAKETEREQERAKARESERVLERAREC